MGSKVDLTEHGRTTINALHTAKLPISKIVKQFGQSCAAIKKYIKDFKKYNKNYGGKTNSKLSPQGRRKITIHEKKGVVSSSTLI